MPPEEGVGVGVAIAFVELVMSPSAQSSAPVSVEFVVVLPPCGVPPVAWVELPLIGGDWGGSSVQSPSSSEPVAGSLVGVLLGGVVVPLVKLPVKPPLTPEAAMRAKVSFWVSQARLVPDDLTRGSA